MSEIDEEGVLKEDLSEKLDIILEYVKDIPDIKGRLVVVEEKIDRLDLKMDIIEPVIKVHSSRINRLEQKVFESNGA